MHHFAATSDGLDSSHFFRFIFAEVPYGESIRYILDSLYHKLPPEQRANASIILRPEPRFQLSKSRIQQLAAAESGHIETLEHQYVFLSEVVEDNKKTFARFSSHPIHILASEHYGHFLTANLNPTATDSVDPSSVSLAHSLINTIRNAEIDHLIKIGRCKLPRLGQRYYKAPSGRYMRAFLRVGNLQVSRSAIDAVYFWLLPHLRNCKGIVTDTWSISSISQNASRRLVDYAESNQPPCPIEMLGDYHDQSEHYGRAAAETIDRFLSRVEAPENEETAKVLILISATHTGSMVDIIHHHLNHRGIKMDNVNFVSLFRLSPASSIPALRDLSDDEDFAVVLEPTEEEKSTAIQIHSRLYFPATPVDVEKRLLLEAIRPYGDFCRRYGDIPFARVHRTDNQSDPLNVRHHAIWIDTKQLIGHPEFVTLFRQKILNLQPPPSIIIHPDHCAARVLSSMACDALRTDRKEAFSFPHNDLNLITDMSEEDAKIRTSIENLSPEQSVLFLDDAFITGTRISSYQKNLRELSFAGPFHYLVAISRPEEDRIWNDQRRAFIGATASRLSGNDYSGPENRFDYVEQLILPNWDEDRCPWCVGKEQEAQLRQSQSTTPVKSTKEGMSDDIFIVPEGFNALELKSGSIFGPPSTAQSNVFCTVAGALQILRTKTLDKSPLLDDACFPINPVLHESYYLRYFTDSILMAAIFRAARASELVFANMDREKRRTKAILRFLRTKTTGDLECEVALAESLGKFPELKFVYKRALRG